MTSPKRDIRRATNARRSGSIFLSPAAEKRAAELAIKLAKHNGQQPSPAALRAAGQ